ncbi:MAG TPA: glycoside hydrolase family 9 protein [Polyangiaceae bacterium]|nr:glycoside hydrolase family 9 protein [Polyangiaceae bacterium]
MRLERALALFLGLGCGKAVMAPAKMSEGSKPAAEVSAAASTAEYPKTPTRPPPVPSPAGQGASVPLQRYIALDQFGYRPEMTKIAVLVDPEQGWNAADSYQPEGEFQVRRWEDGSVAFSARITAWNDGKLDANSGDRGSWFNFTRLKDPGLYYVYDPQHQVRSHPFEIAEDVYDKVLKTALRMFYFNRANFEKKKPFACQGERCWLQGVDNVGPHQDKEARSVTDRNNKKTERDLSGGWWDAGDTNKYVTFSAEPVHQLLTAYEERPEVFSDDFGIPESQNGLPDLIDELLVEISWLEKMQPKDLEGGVLLKEGDIEHGEPIPEKSDFPRYYYPEPCSSAAIVAAGEFAHAALVLRDFPQLRQRAAELGERAERAYAYYHAHPKSDACDDGTIKAGDADKPLAEQDQNAVVAAVYLFALTGKQDYDDYVVEHYASTEPFQSDQWSLYRQHQGDALLYYTHLEKANGSARNAILQRKLELSQSIDIFRMRPQFDLYRAFMRPVTYHWGSNNQRAATGNTNYDLIQHKLAKSPEDRQSFYDRAAGMLHSFHGLNPMQLVYLTNMYAVGGDACADEAYHTWFRDKDPKWDNARESELGPAPGYVTGGPNKEYCKGAPPDHACTHSPVRDQPPGKAYVDTNTGWEPTNPYDKSWEMTEPAIYYQASYVRLLSKFAK